MTNFLCAILLIFCFVVGVGVIVYWGVIILDLLHNCHDYKTKKRFWVSFIPFYRWIKPLIYNYNQLD